MDRTKLKMATENKTSAMYVRVYYGGDYELPSLV